MAITVNKEIKIMWKLNPDSFTQMNTKVLSETTRRFGSSEKGVNSLLAQQKMLELLMPNLVSFSKTDLGWQKAIANYWHRLQLDIPQNGKKLNVGFEFDINDTHDERSKYIKILSTEHKLKTTEELAAFVMSKVPVNEQWKYGNPLSAFDYLIYIYSFNYRDVANSVNELEKSSFIRFYIHNDDIVKEQKKIKDQLKIQAQTKYISILTLENKDEMILDLLTVIEKDYISEILTQDVAVRQIRLFDIVNNKAEEFLNVYEDTSLTLRAHIERLINAKIIKRLPNSDIVVDSEEPTIVLGNTTNETISWFSNIEQNKPKISEYSNKLKAIK